MEYVDWDEHRANTEHLANPLQYTYLKGMTFAAERELRISLSTLGLGHFAFNDGSPMPFPPSLQMQFDFRVALAGGAVRQILRAPDCDAPFLEEGFARFGIAPAPGSDPA